MTFSKAKVTKIDNLLGMSDLTLQMGSTGQDLKDIPLVMPYAGRGWGILAGVEVETNVLTFQDGDDTYAVAYLPNNEFYRAGGGNSPTDAAKREPEYKTLEEGEIALQSKENSLVFLDKKGTVELSTSDGNVLQLNKSTDTINQLSINQVTVTEAGMVRNGLIKRDIRTDSEKEDEQHLDILGAVFANQENLNSLGADSSHEAPGDIVGVFDVEEGSPSILSVPGIKDVPGSTKIVENIINPGLTEFRIDVNEFADGITGLSENPKNKETVKKGYLPSSLGARFVLGTVVEENGRMPRFDYVFGRSEPTGHGEIWKLPGINDTGLTTDFKVDMDESVGGNFKNTDQTQWISHGINKLNTAQMFQLVLNTRGADHKGNIPNSSKIGSPWALMVDKEGMTKWNIPAGTNIEGKESFRLGRSLLWNMEGSLTQSIGKETGKDLKRIVDEQIATVEHRKDRSWVADFEGTIEHHVGADELGQSKMIEMDGSLAFKYGKSSVVEASVSSEAIGSIKSPSKSGKRVGNSITGITDGGVDFNIGKDGSGQSITLASQGMMKIAVGQDDANNSFLLEGAGNIEMKSGGNHTFKMMSAADGHEIAFEHGKNSLFQMDKNGNVTLKTAGAGGIAGGTVKLEPNGSVTLSNNNGNINLAGTGEITLSAFGSSIAITSDGIQMSAAGTSVVKLGATKVDISSVDFEYKGVTAWLNASKVALTPSGTSSAFNVAAIGPGHIDPFTGNPCSTGGAGSVFV